MLLTVAPGRHHIELTPFGRSGKALIREFPYIVQVGPQLSRFVALATLQSSWLHVICPCPPVN